MSAIFGSSIDVGERLQVVRWMNREKCETALASATKDRLQATVVKALQARLRRLAKVASTITFEYHGQDFLEWDLDAAGKVIECRPFQASLWCGRHVVNHKSLKTGTLVILDDMRTVKHPPMKVRRFKAAKR
jgi:hypothetical protein